MTAASAIAPAIAPKLVQARARGPGALLVRAATLAAIAALPVAFNAWIDPARLVAPRTAEREIAQTLSAGLAVTDYVNYDDRAIERFVAERRTERPEVLAIGSSRVQLLPAAAFPGRSFVNAGLAGARLDDMLGAYGLYDDARLRPRRVVLNVDPWTERAVESPSWGSLLAPREKVARRAGLPVAPVRDRLTLALSTARQLASPEYFRLSVFSLRQHGPQGIQWTATRELGSHAKTRLPDGTVVWPETGADSAAALAGRYARQELARDARYLGLGEALARDDGRLERFVAYLRGTGVEVTLLLQPYSPEVYRAMSGLPGRPLPLVEARAHAIASRTGARVVGGFDPVPLGYSAGDFHDESHMRPDALVRLLATPSDLTGRR